MTRWRKKKGADGIVEEDIFLKERRWRRRRSRSEGRRLRRCYVVLLL